MSAALGLLADTPLLLLAAVWLSVGLRLRDRSQKLELLAASVLLASTSVVLWNALALPTVGAVHLVAVIAVIALTGLIRGLGRMIPAGGAVMRGARYAAGAGLSGAVLAASLGQYAPSA